MGGGVLVTRSSDEGKSFQRAVRATSKATGACGCCGLRAFAESAGAVYILFRGAAENVNRDEILLVSRQPGAEFGIANAHPWKAHFLPDEQRGTDGRKRPSFGRVGTRGAGLFCYGGPEDNAS